MRESAFNTVVEDVLYLRTPFGKVFSGVTLVIGEKICLIDSGASAQTVKECILPALKEKGLTPNDISYLLCSHTHGDHIGGHSKLKELSGASVVAADIAAEKLRDPLKFNKQIRAQFPFDSPPPSIGLCGTEPDILMEDGEMLGRLQLLHTPGHDNDSLSWLDNKTGTLITGDSVQLGGTIVQGIAFYVDLTAYRESIKKLINLNAENLIAGHDYKPYGHFAKGQKETQKYLQASLEKTFIYDERLKRITKIEKDLRKIAVKLIEEEGGNIPQNLFLPLYTVSQHLNNLAIKYEYKEGI